MRYKTFFILWLAFLAGCASAPGRDKRVVDLKKQLEDVSVRLEAATKENLDLEKELALFKNSQDIDSKNFIDAMDAFGRELEPLIAASEVTLELTDRGLDIVIVAENLFVSGSDALSDDGKLLLDRILKVLSERFFENYIYVEGHTDNQSLAVFEWDSDWDFSFARALNVVHYLKEKGIDPLRLSASGLGQYRPRVSNDTKEGRRLNRRIEIVISPRRVGYF